MNRNIWLATTIIAAAAAVFYLVTRKRKSADSLQQVPLRKSRHLVHTFSKAKQQILPE